MRVAIHIGIAKTGTTWLQTRCLPQLPGYHFARGDYVLWALLRNLVLEPDDHFAEAALGAHVGHLERRLDAARLLISEETLSGYLFNGGADRPRTAGRLSRAFPNARILLVVREQGGFLRSLYHQYVANGGYRSFRDFCLSDDVEGAASPLAFAEYDHLVAAYAEAFGIGQITVLPFERLRSEPEAFLADVYRSFDVDPTTAPRVDWADAANVSMSRASRAMLLQVNRRFRRSEFNSAPAVRALEVASVARPVLQAVLDRRLLARRPRRLHPSEEELLAELRIRFAESNSRLQALVDLPLADYGYAVGV